MTISEAAKDSLAVFLLAELSRDLEPVASQIVVDNPTVAWRNNESGVLDQLHPDLVFDYRELLDRGAEQAIAPLLAQVWAEEFAAVPGFELRWGTEDDVLNARYRIANDRATYHRVWDEAASRIDVDALVTAAGLDDLRRTTYSD